MRSTDEQNARRGADTSAENHGLLIQLNDHLKSFEVKLDTHISATEIKSAALNSRIDETQERSRRMVEEIKDSLAAKGKISSGSMLAMVAVLMSAVTLIGGVVSAYVSVRLGNIMPLIESNTQALHTSEIQQMEIRENLHKFQLDAVATDATSRSDREWIKEGLANNRVSIRALESHDGSAVSKSHEN